MGTVHQATVARFREACRELESWLMGRIEFHGIQFRCAPDSPNTFEDLTSAGIPIPVPTYENRTDTIYYGCNVPALSPEMGRVGTRDPASGGLQAGVSSQAAESSAGFVGRTGCAEEVMGVAQ